MSKQMPHKPELQYVEALPWEVIVEDERSKRLAELPDATQRLSGPASDDTDEAPLAFCRVIELVVLVEKDLDQPLPRPPPSLGGTSGTSARRKGEPPFALAAGGQNYEKARKKFLNTLGSWKQAIEKTLQDSRERRSLSEPVLGTASVSAAATVAMTGLPVTLTAAPLTLMAIPAAIVAGACVRVVWPHFRKLVLREPASRGRTGGDVLLLAAESLRQRHEELVAKCVGVAIRSYQSSVVSPSVSKCGVPAVLLEELGERHSKPTIEELSSLESETAAQEAQAEGLLDPGSSVSSGGDEKESSDVKPAAVGESEVPAPSDLPDGFKPAGFLDIYYCESPGAIWRPDHRTVQFGPREWWIVSKFIAAKGEMIKGEDLVRLTKGNPQRNSRKNARSAIGEIKGKLKTLGLTISNAIIGDDCSRCLCEFTNEEPKKEKKPRSKRKKAPR